MDRPATSWLAIGIITVSALIGGGCSDSPGSARQDVGGPTDTTDLSVDTDPAHDIEDSSSENPRDAGQPNAPPPVSDADDVTTLKDIDSRDARPDPEDVTVDTTGPMDATDVSTTEDIGASDVTSDASQLQQDAGGTDTSSTDVRPDTSEFQDTCDTSGGRFSCPPASEYRGVCSFTLYCCKNESLDKKCQYGNPCKVPEVLADDPEWVCEPC